MSEMAKTTGGFLPGFPDQETERIFHGAPCNEIVSEKFDSPEFPAASTANAFGFSLKRP